MEESGTIKPPKGPGAVSRKSISLSPAQLVKESFLRQDSVLPLVIEPAVEGVSLLNWAASNQQQLEQKLRHYGAILFRGFKVNTVEQFEEFMKSLAGELLDYSYRSTPRTQVSGKIYTSTEYPAHQSIPLHNEMAYSRQWPMVLGFFCLETAEEGGETPIADSRKVFARIDPEIRERFGRRRVSYVRNYGDGLDLPWQNVFQTESRAEVEDFCRRSGIEFEWQGHDRLRTSQVCQAVAVHPKTGEEVWFNQAHLFHVSSLNSEIRESLLAASRDEPPRNAYYGDGASIEDRDFVNIRAAYDAEAVVFPWRKGNIMAVDNMLVAHGRRPFRGTRRIVVGMGQLHSAV